METRLFLKIVSLVLAASLYVIVATDFFDSPRTIATIIPTETIREETVTDVPVVVNYDSERYIISGIPETVDVTFKGTSSLLQVTLNRGAYEVIANLEDVSEGEYHVTLEVINLDASIEYTIDPKEVTVTVAERDTAEFPVSIDIQGIDDLRGAGYVVTDTSLDTTTAEVVGTRASIAQISSLQAVVNVAGRQESFTEIVDIIAYDSNGERMGSVSITPNTTEATVTIVEVGQSVISKEVPVTIEATGTAPSGIFISSMEAYPDIVTIFGEQNTLDNITSVTASVPLETITENTEEEKVSLTLPTNVRAISPSIVSVKINLEEEETRTFSDVPIDSRNLSDDLDVSFVDSSTATVTVTAVPSILDTLTSSDIALFIDLHGLGAGTQSVSLQVVEVANARIDTGDQQVKVELTEKNVEDAATDDGTEEDEVTDGGDSEDETAESETLEDETSGNNVTNDTEENN